MDDIPWQDNLVIILITLIFSAFFSGMEIAFISANKLKIELDKKQGHYSGRILSAFLLKPSRFIGSMLLGNNIALVIYGMAMSAVLGKMIAINSSFLQLLIQTTISTLIILVTAEFLPKTVFRSMPNFILKSFSIPLILIYWILYLPMIIIIGFSEYFLKILFGIEFSEEKVAFGKVDLDHYIEDMVKNTSKKHEIDTEIQIFRNALDFSKTKARECMIPRTEMISVDIETDVNDLRKKFIETGLSKILVFRDSIDNIIGYTHSYEMFKKPSRVKNILLPVEIVPEAMPVSEVLENFIKKNKSIAVVVDEFGGTAGLITVEDIVEEIFGEIEDEHDKETLTEKIEKNGEMLFSARLEIDYINEKYKLNLPESDDYETLAGFIINIKEEIPRQNDVFEWQKWEFETVRVTDNKIELIAMRPKTVAD